MILQKKTQVTGFYGRLETWGILIQTIRSGPTSFTCMTTFGPWIALSCSNSLVRIYHAVTGALRLSLRPMGAVKLVRGSPDGSTIFCLHQENSITLWDVQTGGLIRTSTLPEGAQDIAISLKGHYLACGFSSGFIKVWEVANWVEDVATRDAPSNTPFCWMEPEEQLAIADGLSVHVWDIVAGSLVHSFTIAGHKGRPRRDQREIGIEERIFGVVYSWKLYQLAIITKSPLGGTLTIINPQAGTPPASLEVPEDLTCFTLSRTTKELVCGTQANGLSVLNLSRRWLSWRHFKHSQTVKGVSSLPNGTIAVDSGNCSVQLLSLDARHTQVSQSTLALATSTFDQDRIIAFYSPTDGSIQLLETLTMSNLVTFSAPNNSTNPLTAVLCASLENHIVVYYSQSGPEVGLKLHNFCTKHPTWTAEANRQPSACGISPHGTRLVTFHDMGCETRIYVRNAKDGKPQAELSVDSFISLPPHITFDSETRFYSYHGNYRIPYNLNLSWSGTTHQIIRREQQPWTVESNEREFEVDSSREWVVSGGERICWIPPGYVKSDEDGYRWAGSDNLVMVGEDGVLRKLTFRSQEHR